MKTRVEIGEYFESDYLQDGRLLLYMQDEAGNTVRLKMREEVARRMVEDLCDLLASSDARCSQAYLTLIGCEEINDAPAPSEN